MTIERRFGVEECMRLSDVMTTTVLIAEIQGILRPVVCQLWFKIRGFVVRTIAQENDLMLISVTFLPPSRVWTTSQ